MFHQKENAAWHSWMEEKAFRIESLLHLNPVRDSIDQKRT